MDFKPFIDPRLKMGWNERIGYGVFADKHISKGEFVEMAPVLVADKMPDGDLAKYVMAWEGKIALPLGWTMLYNHSDENSCDMVANFQDRLLAIVTKRDMAPGEQLTVDYGPDWFSSRGMEKVRL